MKGTDADPSVCRLADSFMPVLITKSLSKSYGSLSILTDITISVQAGESISITGPSGSGKSTLLHIIGTLDEPTSGFVMIEGEDPSKLDDGALSRFRNERIGFVFQDAYLLPQFSVLENVLLPIRAFGSVTENDQARGRDLLQTVGLGERLTHLPAQLSGGERQRVAIARSLIMRPRLLLCDEPTGNLDQQTADQVTETILKTSDGEDRALILITHSDTLASRTNRHFRLREGQCYEV